jgi:ATP-binding cassette subfamily C protein CydD
MTRPGGRRPARVDRRLLAESRDARMQLRIAAALGVLTAAAVLAQAVLLGRLLARAAVDHAPLRTLAGTLAALAGVVAIRALAAGAFDTSGRLGATRVMSELRGRLAARILLRSPLEGEDERTGELTAAAVQGIDSLEAYFAGYLPQLVLGAAVPLAILVWVVPADPIAGLVLGATIPILIGFMILVGKGAQAKARSRWRALSVLSGHFLEVVRGLPTLRAYRREAAQAPKIELIAERYRAETMGTLRIAFLSALVLELCAMVGTALVAATIGIQLDGGHLGLQAGLTVLLLAPELYGPLRAIGQQFHASTDAMAAAERIFAVLDAPPALRETERRAQRVPDPAREPVAFEAVDFAYPARPGLVLDALDLELAPGLTTALVGRSGAGKSTVVALLLRLADPLAGVVRCGGIDLREVSIEAWHAQLAWVPQRARIYAATLAENIALAAPGASRRAVRAAATAAGLDELVASLPHGLETMLGEGGRGLSAGQAQRVALARTFVHDAALVILDEPTAHLDGLTAELIAASLERSARGRTMLIVTHDVELAGRADHRVTLAPHALAQVPA